MRGVGGKEDDPAVVATVTDKLPCHKQAAPDIDRKRIVDDAPGDALYGVQAVHIAVRRIVDQDVNLAEPLQDSAEDIFHGILVGNVALNDQEVGAHRLEPGLHGVGISGIRLEIPVRAVPAGIPLVERPGDALVHQGHLRPFAGRGQRRRRSDPLRVVRPSDQSHLVLQSIVDHSIRLMLCSSLLLDP